METFTFYARVSPNLRESDGLTLLNSTIRVITVQRVIYLWNGQGIFTIKLMNEFEKVKQFDNLNWNMIIKGVYK